MTECPLFNQPKLRGKYYGISAKFYNPRDAGTVCSGCEKATLTIEKIPRSSKEFCGKDCNEIRKNPYAEEVCFGVNCLYRLLFKGYKFQSQKRDNGGKLSEWFQFGLDARNCATKHRCIK